MTIKEIKSGLLGDCYYMLEHPTGLRIFIYPKEGSNSTYAIFGTQYGSVDTCFKTTQEKEYHKIPDGVAHFLEHKLFESEDGDAFAKYAKTGASANAYTSFDTTCYLFSCTENVYESLEILLNFVQSPYFTEQTVQKEQGIIGQEIRMYDDDPQWRVMFNLLRALYHTHPVKIDIAGSVESISHITPDILYQCYRTFYNLNNMALCITGNVSVEEVAKLVDRQLKPSPPIKIDRYFEQEPKEVVQSRIEQKLSVVVPLFQLGFKENVTQERLNSEQLVATEILLEILASNASPLFRRLLDAGLINESTFSYEYFEGPGYASVIFAGESKEPDRVAEEIKKEILSLRRNGISEQDFQRAKKAIYGRNVASLNSTESIANAIISLTFANRELFDYIETIAGISLQTVEQRLKEQLWPEYSALSVILPIQ